MSDDNDERVVDALVAKRTSELATTPMRSVGYAEGYLAGLKAARDACAEVEARCLRAAFDGPQRYESIAMGANLCAGDIAFMIQKGAPRE